MRTAHKVLLCICAVVGLSAGIGTGVAVYLQPEPVLLACPDVTPIPETREVHTASLLPAWPLPPEATPIPAPRRSVQRKRAPVITNAPSAVLCAPDSLSRIPGDGPDAALHEVPEPGSVALAGIGLAALAIAWARRA